MGVTLKIRSRTCHLQSLLTMLHQGVKVGMMGPLAESRPSLLVTVRPPWSTRRISLPLVFPALGSLFSLFCGTSAFLLSCGTHPGSLVAKAGASPFRLAACWARLPRVSILVCLSLAPLVQGFTSLIYPSCFYHSSQCSH